MRIKKRKLIDFYFNPRENGIIFSMFQDSAFSNLLNSIGISTEQDAHSIDMDYIFNESGLKTCSLLLHNFIEGLVLDEDDNKVVLRNKQFVSWDYVVTTVDQDIINSIIKIRYLKKWNTLLQTVLAEYDPLKPFKVVITDGTIRGLDSTRKNDSKVDSSGASSDSGSSTRKDGIYGFNSDSASDSDTSTSTVTNNTTTEGTSNRDSTETYGSTENTNRNILREGNIGNRSAAQLLEEQREYARFILIEEIYRDLDEILTSPKYEVYYD